MARQPLDPTYWAEIRRHWEFDPDSPSYLEAARRAAENHDFALPTKAAIAKRAAGQRWQRHGSMIGVNESAHLKADALVNADGTRADVDGQVDGAAPKKGSLESARMAQASREESENKRAELDVRHRTEWRQVAVLRQEALSRRHTDPVEAFNRLKVAKITAEITMLQQNGERRAWGMEMSFDSAQLAEMSDAQLEAIAAGKMPR